ncbi:hypothetical protein [uncultured Methanobrevibacter sp.]|uniref:hypothetical protein n=1 Tax=uncultured Methanobrevibacter sp. TaxID=253161 RepID=UPI0025FF2D96|nr:hypothetical protein [uncultured Methanobrevibacter sp.]
MTFILTEFLKDKKDFKYLNLYNNNINSAQSNPSIYIKNDFIYINYRCINYISYISHNEKYKKNINGWIAQNGNVISENYVSCIKNDKVLSKSYKKVNIPETDVFSYYKGLEDGILINWDDIFYLCGTRCDIINEKGIFCIYELDRNFNVVRELILNDDRFNNIEKHWSPIEGMPFTFIRWCNPTEIIKIDKNTGDVISVDTKNKYTDEDFRGNCQTVKYKDGYLSIVHNVSRKINSNLHTIPIYNHYFIKYDNDFNIVSISKPFSFETNDIEFCCGLQIDDENIYVSYSVYDTNPVVIKFNENTLQEIFNLSEENRIIKQVDDIYIKGNNFLRQKYFYGAAACYSRVFSNTADKQLELDSLIKFCTCLLVIKNKGINLFSDDVLLSFLEEILLIDNNVGEPYYMLSIYYGLIKNYKKKEIFKRQSINYRFKFPEVKNYLKIW